MLSITGATRRGILPGMADLSALRRSLFAVWRWPLWAWAVVALLGLVAYVLSPPVTIYLSVRGARSFNAAFAAQDRMPTQKPLYLLVEHSPELCALYQMETDLIETCFGCTQYRMLWGNGRLNFVFDGKVQPD